MKKEILFLRPFFRTMIWGGSALKELYSYNLPNDKIGECWAVSSREDGMTYISNGTFKDKSLKELWENNKELFGNINLDTFPLLTKILDANDDLSVQVHPNDEYAKVNENGSLGKTECWYIIDCKKDSEIVFGHNAVSKEELREMTEKDQWSKFLRRVKIKPGDFFDVPAGTVHAICRGTVILETQQNSDVTYRLYDYDRTDDKGNKRELHLKKAVDVITAPQIENNANIETTQKDDCFITKYVKNDYFSLYKYDVNGKVTLNQNQPFLIVSVLAGQGQIDNYQLKKGDHFIIPHNYGDFKIEGNLELMVSHI